MASKIKASNRARCGLKEPRPCRAKSDATQQRWLDDLELAGAYTNRIESLRDLIKLYDREIDQADDRIHRRLCDDPGYRAIRQIAGVGPVFAAIFVAEIGDVGRFANARRLCSWAGVTPRLRESDAHTHRGHITKQGSRLVRWAAIEAVSGPACERRLVSVKARIGARRGANIGRVAAARHLLTLVYYGLRDGHIRCLEPADAA
jgi:transposase